MRVALLWLLWLVATAGLVGVFVVVNLSLDALTRAWRHWQVRLDIAASLRLPGERLARLRALERDK